MAVIKAISSRASIGRAIIYITKDEKTEEKLISGIECNPDTAIEEMKATKAVWGKEDGRQYKHFVHSFPPDENITPEQAHELAKQLCAERFKGYEVLIATHLDKDHIHSHIIVNSVSYEDGHKIQWSKKDLEQMKMDCNEISRQHGLSVPKKGEEITSYELAKYKVLEKAISGKYPSYVFDCYNAMNAAKATAISREDFINKMQENGFETNWKDSRKYITFSDMDGKKIRNTNLETTFKESFGKEDLEHGFERNLEANIVRASAADQLRGRKADSRTEYSTGRSEARDSDVAIEKLNASIGKSKSEISRDDSARADRLADEQSRKSERNGNRESRAIEKSGRSEGRER